MGATRRASRRMQRRGIQQARKASQRAFDAQLAQLRAEVEARQVAHLQQVADDWDPFASDGEPV